MLECFCARVQVELLNRRRSRTRLELSTALFEYGKPNWDRFRKPRVKDLHAL
jgi:hypothetical protein